jgi:hypothetical protein
MDNICVFTACTENYLERALSLYNSLNKYNSNIYFYISLININKDNLFEKIKNDKLTIVYDNVKYKDDILKAYASCVRAKIFPQLLNKHKIVFWMDADTIVRKKLNKLFLKLLKLDILLFKTVNIDEKKAKQIGHYKTGIIGINSNNKTKQFSNKWNDSIFNSNRELKWFLDQITISEILNSINKILIGNLEKTYIDWNFEDSSYIWVGKGKRKNTKIYLNEESKYK